MSTLVYMKLLEQSPEKYDRGMRLITLGRVDTIKDLIAERWTAPNIRVLEIGCGTGSLAAKMVARGADVTAIDISPKMLEAAQAAAPEARILHMTAAEIDSFPDGSFDRIVAMLSLSEMAKPEVSFVLDQASRLLSDGGQLIVADEVRPKSVWQWLPYVFIRLPLALLTMLCTQSTTHALKDLQVRVEKAGFKVAHKKELLLGSLILLVVEKA